MMNLRNLILIIGIAVVGMAENVVLAIPCDANLTEPDFYVYGLCFGPYVDGQAPPDSVSVEQIRERLAIITQKPHTQWIRTHSATNGLENIPAEANSLDLKVAMGTWIRDDKEAEINNLVAKAQLGLVDIAVVGNEELYAGASTVNELISDLNDVRQRLDDANCTDIPVTTPEPFDTLFAIDEGGNCTVRHPQLINAMDVVLVNIYPFHKGVHIDIALAYLVQRYQCAVDAIGPSKPVIIGETGWPSDGLTNVDAEPSLANLARYFSESSAWAEDSNVPMFYFSAIDENWKPGPEIEKHWGIWDSNGVLKHTFVAEPVLCETFDPNSNPFCGRRDWWVSTAPDPNIQPSELNSDGQFLRLLYDATGQTWYSAITFNRIAIGTFPRILAEFDFRLDGPDASDDADGFSFMLMPTSLNGTERCTEYNPSGLIAEQPKLPKTFAVGFDVWDGDGLDDLICISWDGKWFPNYNSRIEAPFNLNDGNWHRARIDIRGFDTDKALVTLELTPDIHSPDPCAPVVIVENLLIDDSNHPYVPYENRVEFAGRNGGLDINVDIDNILVRWKPDICDFLDGDANQDCKVDLFDLAILANSWLIDCNFDPDNPACTSE